MAPQNSGNVRANRLSNHVTAMNSIILTAALSILASTAAAEETQSRRLRSIPGTESPKAGPAGKSVDRATNPAVKNFCDDESFDVKIRGKGDRIDISSLLKNKESRPFLRKLFHLWGLDIIDWTGADEANITGVISEGPAAKAVPMEGEILLRIADTVTEGDTLRVERTIRTKIGNQWRTGLSIAYGEAPKAVDAVEMEAVVQKRLREETERALTEAKRRMNESARRPGDETKRDGRRQLGVDQLTKALPLQRTDDPDPPVQHTNPGDGKIAQEQLSEKQDELTKTDQAIWRRVQRSISGALQDVDPDVRDKILKAVGDARFHAAEQQAQRVKLEQEAAILETGIQTLHKRLGELRGELRRTEE